MSKIVVNGHFKVVLVKQLVLEVETLRIPGSSIQASPLAADLGEKRQVFTSVSEKAFCTSLENCPEAAGPKSRLWQSPAGARESTFILTPQRGGGVKVLLRYFLIRK